MEDYFQTAIQRSIFDELQGVWKCVKALSQVSNIFSQLLKTKVTDQENGFHLSVESNWTITLVWDLVLVLL